MIDKNELIQQIKTNSFICGISSDEINYAKTKAFIEEGEIEQKINLAEMNIDDEAKDKVLELFDELSSVIDRNGADKINAEIAQVLAEAGVDLSGRDYALLQLTNTNLHILKKKATVFRCFRFFLVNRSCWKEALSFS